jgi:hypothetical protein
MTHDAEAAAIIARYARHSTVVEDCYYDDDDRKWKPIPELKELAARRAREADKKNTAATIADELRTEGHQDTRRPLSCPHETP